MPTPAVGHVIEPLERHHDRSAFACGHSALDNYIRHQASQDARRGVARVFVAVATGEARVMGYYTLSATNVRHEEMPSPIARRLPHYPVPAVLLGRLAVDLKVQGQGLGRSLLADAAWRVLHASEVIGVYALVVDAIDEAAVGFYTAYGFLRLPDNSRRLFLPVATLREASSER